MSASSHGVNRDGPAKVVSERLGHATIAITLDVYSHVIHGTRNRRSVVVLRMAASLPALPQPI